MKIKVLIMLLFVFLVFSQRDITNGKLMVVETSLDTANTYSYKTLCDTVAAHLVLHYAKTTAHELADGTTESVTSTPIRSVRDAVSYLNSVRTSLVSHFSQDTCHVSGADETTSIPSALNSNTENYRALKNYASKLVEAIRTHKASEHSTRYKLLGKEFTADFIAHCANDTTDGGTVHYKADETYNTVTFDSTNVDSIMAGWNRLKGRYNGHLSLYAEDGSEVHQGYNVADSITTADATDYTTLIALVNEAKEKYNQHCARDTTGTAWTASVHKEADATNTVTTSDVSTTGRHISADDTELLSNFAEIAHDYLSVPEYMDRITIQISGTGTSSGASFRTYGSLDGDTWTYIDSTAVITENGSLHPINTNYWPFIKVYCSGYTDGTWEIKLEEDIGP